MMRRCLSVVQWLELKRWLQVKRRQVSNPESGLDVYIVLDSNLCRISGLIIPCPQKLTTATLFHLYGSIFHQFSLQYLTVYCSIFCQFYVQHFSSSRSNILSALVSIFYQFFVEPTEVYCSTKASRFGTRFDHLNGCNYRNTKTRFNPEPNFKLCNVLCSSHIDKFSEEKKLN